MSFYIYSNTIVRKNKYEELEIKNHKNDAWEEVKDPSLWRRIDQNGLKVNKKEAKEFYENMHNKIIISQKKSQIKRCEIKSSDLLK